MKLKKLHGSTLLTVRGCAGRRFASPCNGSPNTEAFRDIVGCDERGYLIAGEDCATDVPGIFAAGDIRTKALRQIVTAVSDGACAVASVEQYLGTK